MLHHKKNTFLETKKNEIEEGQLTTKSAASSVKTDEAAFFFEKNIKNPSQQTKTKIWGAALALLAAKDHCRRPQCLTLLCKR